MNLHVLVACHNRRDQTVRAVTSIAVAALTAGVEVDFTVFDDGSADGTRDALIHLGLGLQILSGDGSAFWAKSMALAESAILARQDVYDDDWLVWLNDDIVVDETAMQTFIRASSSTQGAVLVGAMRDPETKQVTYGGYRKVGWHPLRFAPVLPASQGEPSTQIDTFNGNLVFVPLSIARTLGGIDGGFSHALADIDYGIRTCRLGIPLLLLPGTSGSCPRNAPEPQDGLRRKWRRFVGVKGGGNYSSLTRIVRKGYPRAWPLYVGATYLLWWLRNLLKRPWRNPGVKIG